MNEKIKLLAGKALDTAVPGTWTALDYEQVHELLACHAELIVRDIHQYVDGLDTAQIISNGILKRYGVK